MVRKMIVALLALATSVSLVLGVVSFWRPIPGAEIWISSLTKKPTLQVALIRGTLHAVYAEPIGKRPAVDSRAGFTNFYFKQAIVGSVWARGAGVPVWALSAVFGVCPITACVRGPLRCRSRRKRGECIHCGYNLTGLPEPRCPECGRPA